MWTDFSAFQVFKLGLPVKALKWLAHLAGEDETAFFLIHAPSDSGHDPCLKGISDGLE